MARDHEVAQPRPGRVRERCTQLIAEIARTTGESIDIDAIDTTRRVNTLVGAESPEALVVDTGIRHRDVREVPADNVAELREKPADVLFGQVLRWNVLDHQRRFLPVIYRTVGRKIGLAVLPGRGLLLPIVPLHVPWVGLAGDCREI